MYILCTVDGNLTFERFCQYSIGGDCIQASDDYQECGSTGIEIPEFMYDQLTLCNDDRTICENDTYPQGSGLDTDLVIYFSGYADIDSSDECSGVSAFASYCETNSYDRPIAGYINLCRLTIAELIPFTWERANILVIHETFHVLGIHSVYIYIVHVIIYK